MITFFTKMLFQAFEAEFIQRSTKTPQSVAGALPAFNMSLQLHYRVDLNFLEFGALMTDFNAVHNVS